MGVLISRLFALAALLCAGSAAAQGRVMVLNDPRVVEGVRDDVSDALSDYSQVGVDAFVRSANAKRLDPLSDAAFSRALPTGLVDVAVVLLPARRGLSLVLRSGRDGTVLSQHALKLRRGKLPKRALKSIPKYIQAAMLDLPPAAAEAPDEEPIAKAAAPTASRIEEEVVEDERVVDDEPEVASEQAVDEEASSEPTEEPEQRLFRLHVDVGTGVSSRALRFPIEAGTGNLSLGPSAAFDIGLEAAYDPPSAVSWGIQLRYQTTLGAQVDEHPIGGVERPMGIRSARFEALFAPAWDLSEVVQLRLAVGYGLRGLRTEVHDQASSTLHSLQTPDYTLSGPVARVALRLALGDSVALTLAPEAQLLVSVGSDLKQRGVAGSGLAVGGVASLVVSVSRLLSIYLAYREAHASIAGQPGHANVSDVERYITAGLRGAP